MKIRRLDLERFGHFDRASLAFPEGAGLCVVHGDNEAGKTTILHAIRWLLFGGKDNRFVFDGVDPAKLAVGARLELSREGRVTAVEVRRSRGKGAGLNGTTTAGDEIDEDWIHARLSRPNRAVFENVFGFSLEGLAQGGKALAHEQVASAIYGGGLGGGIQPDRILEDLEGEKDKLFVEKGSKQSIALRTKRIEELEKQLRTITTKSDEWHDRQREVDDKARLAGARAGEAHELRRALERLHALQKAVGPFRDRERAAAALRDIVVPEALPVDAGARHAALVTERTRIARLLDAERTRAREAAERLAALHVDDALLAVAADVDALARRLSRVEAAEADLPRRRRELEGVERNTELRLAELRPDWDLARLREARLDVQARAELDASVAAHDELVSKLAVANDAVRTHEDELASCDQALAALPAAVDVAPLRAWQDGWSGFVAFRDERAKLEARLPTLARRVDELRRRLSPPLHDRDPASIAPPRSEEVVAFERERDQHVAARTKIASELEAHRAELESAERSLREVDATAAVPTEADLAASRARRDSLFDELLRSAGTAAQLAAASVSYERARAAADTMVDRMRAQADVVQRRAVHEARAAELRGRIEAVAAKLEAEGAALADVDRRFAALFSSCGFAPLAPAAMRAWLADRETYLAAAAEQAELVARRDVLAQETSTFVARGRALGGEADVDELRVRIAARIDAESRRASEAENLVRQAKRAREQLARQTQKRDDLAARKKALDEGWGAIVAPFGLDASISPAAARAVVLGLVETRDKWLGTERTLRDVLDELSREIASFDEQARALAERLGIQAAASVSFVQAVEAKLAAAREAARARDHASAVRGDAATKATALEAEQARVAEQIAALHAAAGVADEAAFEHVARERVRAEELRRARDAAEATLVTLRANEDPSTFDAEVEDVDPIAIAQEIEAKTRSLGEIETAVRTLDRELGEAQARLRAIDGGLAAADLRADLEQERTSLRADVERWAVLAFAEQLLRGAIARFEREHQPELLDRASSIFSGMTGGRYVRVRRHLDGESLWVEREGGAELTPDQLSTGTREQLWLAIRLAYVDQYRRGAEALPIVLDDVLVNFDAGRARSTLKALAEFGRDCQVLLFTCHRHMVDLARDVPATTLLEVPARS